MALTGYLTDRWQIAAGFGHQIAEVVEGRPADIGHEVPWLPHNTFSLWNKYQFTDMFAAGLGVVHKTDFFAALDVPSSSILNELCELAIGPHQF